MRNKDDQILYVEANTGISGDMLVAALIDLGAPVDVLKRVLGTIPIDGFDTEITRKKRAGIDVCDFLVKLHPGFENHDHDMEYLYGHEHHNRNHNETENDTLPTEHADDHIHRSMADIREILDRTAMTDGARKLALQVFTILAQAESQAHGLPVTKVLFHEVGAVDSIVDIIATAVCIDALSPKKVVISPLTEGTGTVRTRHGILPVPVPAVTHIVANEGLTLRQGHIKGELVTPTGAAIAASIRTDDELPETYAITGIGIGGGKRDYDPPSMVRVMWLKPTVNPALPSELHTGNDDSNTVYRLETDIDDCTGEELGRVIERLYEAGAREVHFVPIFMKKNRPSYELVVITDEAYREKAERIIFKETTTIGIRRIAMERTILPRKTVTVKTPYGTIEAKQVALPDGEVRIYPEYESVRELSVKNGLSVHEIISRIPMQPSDTH